MKKNSLLLIAFCLVFILQNCKEVGPAIDLGNTTKNTNDTSFIQLPVPSAQVKSIFVEDFTGVKCSNCPTGHDIVTAFKANYPNRVVSAAMHTNFLGAPYNGQADLRSSKAEDLVGSTNFGPCVAKPAAMVDRGFYNTTSSNYLQLKDQWQTEVDTRLAETTPVNISISKTYDATSRKLNVAVTLQYTAAVSELNKLSVYLTESNIIAYQLMPSNTIDSSYIHNNVMRDILTANVGNSLNSSTELGRVIIRNFTYTVPTTWNDSNLKLIAFVHEYVNSKKVYQVQEVSVK